MAGKYNFTIEQGATFTRGMTWKDDTGTPIDLTGFVATLKAKRSQARTATVINLSSIAPTDDPPGPGGITLGAALGTILIEMTAVQTAALDFDTAVYDLELDDDGDVTRLLEGQIVLSREITK